MNGLTKLGIAGVAGLMAAFPPTAGAAAPSVNLCNPANIVVTVPAATAPTLLDHGWTVPFPNKAPNPPSCLGLA